MTAPPDTSGPPVIGIAGWKNSGKTTLATRLIAEFTRRGIRIASIKHAHHDFEIDTEDTDSARHRRAGAAQVAIVSAKRWALVTELATAASEPSLASVLAMLEPCDLVIVEGYKTAPIPKIEVRSASATPGPALAATDPTVIAIASDIAASALDERPVFDRNDVSGLADLIWATAANTSA